MMRAKQKGKGKNQHVGLLGEQMSTAECSCSACIVVQLILKWMHLPFEKMEGGLYSSG